MKERIGLVLGSGAARGWAHIGVIRGLEAAGIRPQVVCGSSMGSVVGAAYAAGRFDGFEDWVRELDFRRIARYFDLALRGGLIKARKVFEALAAEVPDMPIEKLALPFGAVATDLAGGHEIWLRQGSLYDALRASVALPGLLTPARLDGRWLVDGGLVNPVPVSLCRAMGATIVIAVDLNTALVGRRVSNPGQHGGKRKASGEDEEAGAFQSALQDFANDLFRRFGRDEPEEDTTPPSIYDVVTSSINIMQVRITRSRMAGDPPDVLIAPQLESFGLLDFDRADEAIREGRRAVEHALRDSPYAELG